jgi:hypothetical protein
MNTINKDDYKKAKEGYIKVRDALNTYSSLTKKEEQWAVLRKIVAFDWFGSDWSKF